MKQPDLGKKIAELRKANGLTQDELAEKCNVNNRTIQRIESGEVTPRSYTIKLIFTELKYDIYGSLKSENGRLLRSVDLFKIWLEQLYRYVFDLFNLKTNTMKKIMILSIPFLSICLVLLFSSLNTKAQNKDVIRAKFAKATSPMLGYYNRGHLDSLAMLYHENACMMPDKSGPLYGRESIIAYYQQLYNQGFRFEEGKSQTVVLSDSIIIDRGIWVLKINAQVTLKGSYLEQWHCIKGKWYVENEMTKTDEVLETTAKN